MQRNILKITLACSMALFLAATPVNTLNAAENTAEAAIDTDTQNTGTSELHETYYVNAQNGLKVRSAPSKDSDVITLLPYGTEVTVIGTENNSWYEIEYSNESAYVSASYITKSTEAATEADMDNNTTEADETAAISSPENAETTLGVTPVILALIAAIIIMVLLAIFTAYSFLKRDKNSYSEYNDDEYTDDDDNYDDEDSNDYDYDDDNYNHDYEDSTDEEYYDEEYYDDEE